MLANQKLGIEKFWFEGNFYGVSLKYVQLASGPT